MKVSHIAALILKVLNQLFPSLLLKSSSYEAEWKDQEQSAFTKKNAIFLLLISIGHVVHHFTIDKSEGLDWGIYRGLMSASAGGAALFYISQYARTPKLYKVPAYLVLLSGVILQATSVVWYSKIPYLYAFAFNIVVAWALRMEAGTNILVFLPISVIQIMILNKAGISVAMSSSAAIVTNVISVVMQLQIKSRVENFMLTRKELESQKKIIEKDKIFLTEIQRFLPREIARRMNQLVAKEKLSVIEAVESMMEIKPKQIVSLFCDIRQFTEISKQETDIQKKVIAPNLTSAMNLIEDNHGIPRQVADLIVAFYDDERVDLNFIRAMISAIEMLMVTESINAEIKNGNRIKRYSILTSGIAHVGNFGGTSSSREFTAMGNCMNLAHRIDEFTKKAEFKKRYPECHIVFTSQFKSHLDEVCGRLDIERMDLNDISSRVRDYPEIESLWLLKPTTDNLKLFRIIYEQMKAAQFYEAANLKNQSA